MSSKIAVPPSAATVDAFRVPVAEHAEVSAEVAKPDGFDPQRSPALALAHGAGSNMHHDFMTYFFNELGTAFMTMRFNFLYKEVGRNAPDPAPRLERTYSAALGALRDRYALDPGRIICGGKSMGGRIATHLAAQGAPVGGVVLLGYPLHAPGRTDKLRDAHLHDIRCPLLFVQGTRDKLCDLDLLRKTLDGIDAPWNLHVIEDGDHSFKVPKRTGRTYDDVLAEIRDVVRAWVEDRGGRDD